MSVFLGGVGCVHEETRLDVFINGHPLKVKISDPVLRQEKSNLYLSYNGLDFDYRKGSQPFIKGSGLLYKVTTQEGEIKVHGSHEFLCSDNAYRSIQSFKGNDFCGLMSTSKEKAPFRLYEDIYLLFDRVFKYINWFLIRGEFIRSMSFAIAGKFFDPTIDHIITFLENMVENITANPEIFSIRITNFEAVSAPLTDKQLVHFYNEFAYELSRLAYDQLPRFKAGHCKSKEIILTLNKLKKIWQTHDFRYHPTELSRNKIISIEEIGEHAYWDVQIPDTNNYVAHGMVHHNSGKTYSAGDFLLKMAKEFPKTTGLITANTYTQLINSTLKAITDRWDELGLIRDIDYSVNLGVSKMVNILGRKSFLYSLNNEVPAKGLTVGFWLGDESAFIKKKTRLTHAEQD